MDCSGKKLEGPPGGVSGEVGGGGLDRALQSILKFSQRFIPIVQFKTSWLVNFQKLFWPKKCKRIVSCNAFTKFYYVIYKMIHLALLMAINY